MAAAAPGSALRCALSSSSDCILLQVEVAGPGLVAISWLTEAATLTGNLAGAHARLAPCCISPCRLCLQPNRVALLCRLPFAVHRRGGVKDVLELGDSLADIGESSGEMLLL